MIQAIYRAPDGEIHANLQPDEFAAVLQSVNGDIEALIAFMQK